METQNGTEFDVIEMYNILLIGESGVGKSTFINSLENYLAYETLDEAIEHGLKNSVSCSFITVNESDETVQIKIEGDQKDNNNESCHVIFHGSKSIRLIETPGIDNQHGQFAINDIVNQIKLYKELHCICILLRPNNARLTEGFRANFEQLMTNLPRSAAHNIFFVFTNTRSSFYKPGDTGVALMSLLNQMKCSELIKFSKENVFCFENEGFRYLAALQQGVEFKSHEIDNFSMSWTLSVKESERFFQHVIGDTEHLRLRPVPMESVVNLNKSITIIYCYLPFLIFKLQECKANVNNEITSKPADQTEQAQEESNSTKPNRFWATFVNMMRSFGCLFNIFFWNSGGNGVVRPRASPMHNYEYYHNLLRENITNFSKLIHYVKRNSIYSIEVDYQSLIDDQKDVLIQDFQEISNNLDKFEVMAYDNNGECCFDEEQVETIMKNFDWDRITDLLNIEIPTNLAHQRSN